MMKDMQKKRTDENPDNPIYYTDHLIKQFQSLKKHLSNTISDLDILENSLRIQITRQAERLKELDKKNINLKQQIISQQKKPTRGVNYHENRT